MAAFVHVAPARGPGWSKEAAARALATARVAEIVDRLLADLARLSGERQPRLDYLEREALDAVRSDPETYNLIGRAASPLEGAGQRCLTAAYWHESGTEVDVELQVEGDAVVWGPALAPVPAPPFSHRLSATLDCSQGRVERLEAG